MKKYQQSLNGTGLEELVNSKWDFVYGRRDGDWYVSIRL